MKEIKRCFCNFSFYDQQAIQEKLEEMAQKGWMLEKTGNFMWTYKRIEPKKLRFSVTYFPAASDFDPSPTDGELTKIDYCRQDGWNLVTTWGVMQIFCNEDLDAVPIETEPVIQVENIRRSMKKNVLLPQAVLGGMLLVQPFHQPLYLGLVPPFLLLVGQRKTLVGVNILQNLTDGKVRETVFGPAALRNLQWVKEAQKRLHLAGSKIVFLFQVAVPLDQLSQSVHIIYTWFRCTFP